MSEKKRVVCGFGDCTLSYQSNGALKAHQRKHHPDEYETQGMKVRGAKRQKLLPQSQPQLAPQSEQALRRSEISQLDETMQLALANTRSAIEDEIGELRLKVEGKISSMDDTQSSIVAQLTELKDQFAQLAKKSSKWCVVCFEKENDYTFLPCGHKCMCKDCALRTQRRYQTCPYCRERITKVQRIFDVCAWESSH